MESNLRKLPLFFRNTGLYIRQKNLFDPLIGSNFLQCVSIFGVNYVNVRRFFFISWANIVINLLNNECTIAQEAGIALCRGR